MKKVLLIDDSALMRRVISDIINSDSRFQVANTAVNGKEGLELLSKNTYDVVVLDVNMPVMNGLEMLKELKKRKISAKVMMASTDTSDGAKVTLDALELGAIDFVHKPENALDCRKGEFQAKLLRVLSVVANSRDTGSSGRPDLDGIRSSKKLAEIVRKHGPETGSGRKVVAIASSTGGPRALQAVIPMLPKDLSAPVVLVQHMPAAFTKSLADRLNSMSGLEVKEAQEGDILQCGHVYVAKGGLHLNVVTRGGRTQIHYTDEPSREGVKPCANYMFESLADCRYSEIFCVVLTGMGMDGTEGIKNLKKKKKVHVIAQDEDSCTVYGMPKSIVDSGLADQVVDLQNIAQEIIVNVGVG